MTTHDGLKRIVAHAWANESRAKGTRTRKWHTAREQQQNPEEGHSVSLPLMMIGGQAEQAMCLALHAFSPRAGEAKDILPQARPNATSQPLRQEVMGTDSTSRNYPTRPSCPTGPLCNLRTAPAHRPCLDRLQWLAGRPPLQKQVSARTQRPFPSQHAPLGIFLSLLALPLCDATGREIQWCYVASKAAQSPGASRTGNKEPARLPSCQGLWRALRAC